jgi:hypothetical protein
VFSRAAAWCDSHDSPINLYVLDTLHRNFTPLTYTAILDVTGILWFRRSLESTGCPMDSEEYTPLWIPMGWPLNLNEPALGILRAAYRVQEEPECTKRGFYFG